MKIFVVNCGSSSIKYQLIDMKNESVIAKGLIERIGMKGSMLTHTTVGKDKVKLPVLFLTTLMGLKRFWLLWLMRNTVHLQA